MANPELRRMLEQGEVFFAPAVWDCITARLARHLGFKCLYVPGSGTGIAIGESEPMTTLTQTAMVAERSLEGVDDELPMIVDVMCGFGNPIHVQLTVQTLEDAGVSALHMEDQLFPGRVHYFRGVEHVVSLEEYQQRIEYAVKARKSRDFLIIARNDISHAVEAGENPREEAVKRAHAALEVGADAIFITGIQPQRDDLQYYRSEIKNVPMVTTPQTTRTGELLHVNDYRELGYQVILYPQVIQTALVAIQDAYKPVKETGYLPEESEERTNEIRGLSQALLRLEEKWAVEAATTESGQS